MTKTMRLGLWLLAMCLTTSVRADGDAKSGQASSAVTDTQSIGVIRKVGTYLFRRPAYAAAELSNGTILTYGADPSHLEGARESLESRRRSAGMHGGFSDAVMWQPGLNGWKNVGASPECGHNRLLHTLTPLPDNRLLIAGGLCDGPRMGDDTSLYPPYTRLSLWNGNTQQWETAPSLQVARLYHTATLLSDGSVMLVGGEPDPALYTAEQPVLAAVEHYQGGAVSQLASLHVARARHSATPLDNGALLIAGGVGQDGKALDAVELWDPASQSWRDVTPLHTPRYNHSAVRLSDGRVMVAGGIDRNGQPLASVELWRPDTGEWSTGAALLYPLQGHAATLLAHGDVLIMGGLSINERPAAQAQRWDNRSGRWLPAGEVLAPGLSQVDSDPRTYHVMALAPHPDGSAHAFTRAAILHWSPAPANNHAPYGERDKFAATQLQDGRVLLSGGFRTGLLYSGLAQSPLLDAAEIYDMQSGRFSVTGRMQQRRFMHSSLVLDDGRVLVASGWVWAEDRHNTPVANYPEVWDPQTGEWSMLGAIQFNPGEWVHMARLQDGRVLFFASDEAEPAADAPLGQANYRAWLWNPANGRAEQKEVNARPRSSAAVAILADGRVMRVGGYQRRFVPAQRCPSRRQVEAEEEADECFDEPAYWHDEPDTSAEIWDSRTGALRTVTPPPHLNVHDGKTLVLRNGNVLFVEYSPLDFSNNRNPPTTSLWLWDVRTERWQPFPALITERPWPLLEMQDGTLMTATHQLPPGATEWLPNQALIQQNPRFIQNDAGALLAISTVPPYAAKLDVASRSWQPNAPTDLPPTWKTVPALAALRDGRVMAVARTEQNPKAAFSAYIWDPSTDTWSSAGRLVNQTRNTNILQLPSGAVLHVGQSANNKLLCDLWDAVSNSWRACGDYQMEYVADSQLALGLLEDGRAVVVANTAEAFVFEPSTVQWTRQRIEWDNSGMTWGAPIRSDIPLARIPDAGSLRPLDISPVAAQYWQSTTGDRSHTMVFSDRPAKAVYGRSAPPSLLWDPKGKQWAYVLLPNKMGRNAEFLPDGCALSWMPLTLFNPGTGKVTPLPDPGLGIQSREGNMVVLRDGTVVIAGLPDGNNTGFFHRKASCNGFAASPADAALVPATLYEKEASPRSRPAVPARADTSADWWQKAIDMLLEYRWIILALVVPAVLYMVLRFGVGPLFRRAMRALPEEKRQRLNKPLHWSFALVIRIVVYGVVLVIVVVLIVPYLVLRTIDTGNQCATHPALCIDKETGLLPSVSALEGNVLIGKVKPAIPCRYVGIWSSRRGSIMFRIELKDDGTYAMDPNEYGVGEPKGYTGYWMVQGDHMVWRHNQAPTLEPDINRIITESETRFKLVEVNEQLTQYELIKPIESARCTP